MFIRFIKEIAVEKIALLPKVFYVNIFSSKAILFTQQIFGVDE